MKPFLLFLFALASFDHAAVPPSASSQPAAGALLECVASEALPEPSSFTCNQRSCSPGPAGDSACRASGCSGGCGYGSCLAF